MRFGPGPRMPAGRHWQITSQVCAKGGAKIYRIGSEKTKPSTIIVGTSGYLDEELNRVERETIRCTEAVQAAFQDKFDLKKINETTSPKPILDVSGIISSRTKICGPHTQLVFIVINESSHPGGQGRPHKVWCQIRSTLWQLLQRLYWGSCSLH